MSPTLLTLFRSLCVPSILAGFLLTPISPAEAQSRLAPLANAPISRPLRGEEALQTLGARVREVAEFHRMSENQLRTLFQRDKSLWVDPHGRLFYVCESGLPPQEGPVGESTNTPPINPLYPVGQTFKLHSRPGADRTIFLDFDGHDASATIWGGNNGSVPISRAFDLDGNPTTFSTTERQRIQFIWARVAEDYLHYDIDVTTEDPGVDALKNMGTGRFGMRVAIGGHSLDWYGTDGVGGVAYLNSFDDPEDRNCWVFAKGYLDAEKGISEAASHEAGHTLGLFHDGQSPAVEYYEGQGNWAPIMGIGENRSIVQWSKGEYSQANNTEDDLAKMLDYGAIDRPDDHGDDTLNARPLTGVRPFIWGVISSRTDVDYFSFEAGAGRTIIVASPSPRGPNLRIQLSLYDSNGGLILSTNVADNATTGVMPVTISTILPAGNYFVSVDGIGNGSALSTGYSDYSSLGQYTLTLTLPSDGTWIPISGGAYSWTDTANWNSATYPLGWSGIARINNNIAGNQNITIDSPVTIGGLLLGDPDASHTFTIEASGPGVLQLGATNGNAWISKLTGLSDSITSPLLLQTNLVVTNISSSDLVIGGNLDGPFNLTKFGAGRLVLAGTSANAGLFLSAGVVQLGSTASIGSVTSVTVQAGTLLDVTPQPGWQLAAAQTLAGAGVITGDVSTASSSRLSPGTTTAPGTLTFASQLTLNGGSELRLNLTSTTNTGTGINDLIAVNGNLVLNGIVSVNFDFGAAIPATNGTYTILTYVGTLTGGAANLTAGNAGNRFTYMFDDSTPGEIRVQVSGAPEALVWQGDGVANLWDASATTNWLRGGIPDAFFQNDTVLFDPTGSAAPAVELNGSLSPASLIVSNTTAYTFGGSGHLTGLTSVTKQGNGSLTLNTSNDFSGITVVQDGTLLIGDAAALGLTNTGTTISNLGQLNLNGFALGAERVTLSGSGPSGDGALINTGGVQTNALRNVTLAGNTTLGGTVRWDIRGLPAANLPASFIGNNFAITKTGPNEVWFANLGTYTLGNIIVNEGSLGFEGTNALTFNGSSLTVNAGATLAFLNAFDNDFSRALFLNSCTLQNDSGHNNLTGVTTVSGVVTASAGEAATLDLRGTVTGTGGFTKTGAGILRLAGGNIFSGNITVSEGTVVAGNNNALGSAAGTTTIAAGARLDVASFSLGAEPVFVSGAGINNRGAIINSSGSQPNALRFVTLTGDTTFGGNGRWDIRGNPTGSLLGAFNLSKIAANEIWLANLDATELKAITITRGTLGIQGTTTLGDAVSTMTVASAGTLGISATGTNILTKAFTLNSGTISNVGGSNTVAGNMSLSGANDFDTTSGTTLVLGANLTGSGSFNKLSNGTLILAGNCTVGGAIQVAEGILQIGAGGTGGSLASTLNNNAALVFDRSDDVTHTALINGAGTLTKQNTNRLTLSAANTYSGETTVGAGTLRVGNSASLGATTAGTTVAAGASLDVNGFSLGAEAVTVAGSGVGSAGAVINTGASQTSALRFLTLTGNTTLGGSSRWDLRGVAGTGALVGAGVSLTKTGTNTIGIITVTVDGALGNVAVQQGVLSIEQGTTSLGNPASSVTVSSNAALNLHSLTNPLNKIVVLESGGKLSHSGPVSGGISSTVSGPIALSGGDAFVENSSTLYSLQISSTVIGPGNLNKTASGLVQLNASNNYSGSTLIAAGTLKLGPSASLNATPAISIANGAVFDVSPLGASFVLAPAQILAGNGTVLGNVMANGTVSPGVSVGRLTVSGNATLTGSILMELTKAGSILTNDSLNVTGGLTCGGTLAVVHSGTPLAADDSFRLFTAGTITGAFANYSLPAPGPGLAWDTSTVNSDGWIRVVVNNTPVIGSVDIINSEIVVSGSGGAPGATYHVVTTTNVTLPMLQWSPVATNTFDAGGNFAFTNTVSPTELQQFFRLRVP